MSTLFKRVLLLGFFIFCELHSASKEFPEELGRSWDQGCKNWPATLSHFEGFAPNPDILVFKDKGYFRVQAVMKLKLETQESQAVLEKKVNDLLGRGDLYEKWVLPKLNEKPGGGDYFVIVDALKGTEVEKNKRYILGGPYRFKVLFFEREGYATMEFRRDDNATPPRCGVFSKIKKATRFVYRMTPRKDLLEMLLAEVWIYPDENHLTMQLQLTAKPARLVFELMPEALLRSELLSRGRRIFENFNDFRRTWAVHNSSGAAI